MGWGWCKAEEEMYGSGDGFRNLGRVGRGVVDGFEGRGGLCDLPELYAITSTSTCMLCILRS